MPPAPKYPSQPPPMSDGKNPHVMIVGAGIAGLFLAILLDKAGIPYEIYERAQEVKPLGDVMPVLDQLGLLEEVKAISLPSRAMDSKIIPAFYNLLLSKVQAEKIHLGKKVLSMTQSKEGAMIRCADGTTYHGDVLVGADGAYSGVRQSLYKFMKEHQILPVMDSKDLNKGYIALVGTTGPLDPEKFPVVAREDSSFSQVIGRGTSYNWSLFNVANRKICWVVVQQLASLEETELVRFRNSEYVV
ncbi:hypothetical protein BGZ83_003709 [Gryganskiella cystojenkinii]|nr:hypothetical protein BGZ83_003709 [Gryganskiella cystojenkinii]